MFLAGVGMLYRRLDPRRALQALHQPPFRWFLVERMVGAETWAMRAVARGWLIYSLTGSVLALAAVDAVRAAVGVVLSPVAGVISDRFEKRMILVVCRVVWAVANLALAALIILGGVQMWHI